jgi:hypothetical protein
MGSSTNGLGELSLDAACNGASEVALQIFRGHLCFLFRLPTFLVFETS